MCVQNAYIVCISMLSELIIHIHITSLGSWESFSLYETSARQIVKKIINQTLKVY